MEPGSDCVALLRRWEDAGGLWRCSIVSAAPSPSASTAATAVRRLTVLQLLIRG